MPREMYEETQFTPGTPLHLHFHWSTPPQPSPQTHLPTPHPTHDPHHMNSHYIINSFTHNPETSPTYPFLHAAHTIFRHHLIMLTHFFNTSRQHALSHLPFTPLGSLHNLHHISHFPFTLNYSHPIASVPHYKSYLIITTVTFYCSFPHFISQKKSSHS